MHHRTPFIDQRSQGLRKGDEHQACTAERVWHTLSLPVRKGTKQYKQQQKHGRRHLQQDPCRRDHQCTALCQKTSQSGSSDDWCCPNNNISSQCSADTEMRWDGIVRHIQVQTTQDISDIFSNLIVTYIHTYIHPFNGPLSGTTRVSRYQKGKTNPDFTEARDSEWQWHQLGRMQVCTSHQTDNHASTPPLSFYRPDALPATQPTASKHWRQ